MLLSWKLPSFYFKMHNGEREYKGCAYKISVFHPHATWSPALLGVTKTNQIKIKHIRIRSEEAFSTTLNWVSLLVSGVKESSMAEGVE